MSEINIFAPAHSFKGGVHPPMNKQLAHLDIEPVWLPSELRFALNQNQGMASAASVAIGDTVSQGQAIAHFKDDPKRISHHAPVAAEVIAITAMPMTHPSQLIADTIILKPTAEYQAPKNINTKPIEDYSVSEIAQALNEAGLVGQGGAAFPTAIKLALENNMAAAKTIDTLIINAMECEPFISCDDAVLRHHADEVLSGMALLQTLLNCQHMVIALEDNKPQATEILKQAIAEHRNAQPSSVRLVIAETKYPSGGEKQTIEVVTGQQLPKGKRPSDMGVTVLNVGTVRSVYQAVVQNQPVLTRVVTLTGDGLNRPHNREVLIGTPIAELIAATGGYKDNVEQLIIGGPMMGFALPSDNYAVNKACNAIVALTPAYIAQHATETEMPCIRCGKCMDACPINLLPQQMLWYIQSAELNKMTQLNTQDCIECGACSYVCPSHIPLVDYFKHGKYLLQQQQIDAQRADLARLRNDNREARLERIKLERQAQRDAHKKKAQQGNDQQALIQAAVERSKQRKAALTNDSDGAARKHRRTRDD